MEDLPCGAETGFQRGMDGAPVAGGVGVFSGEEEGVFDGFSEEGGLGGGVAGAGGADGQPTVGTQGVFVGLPIVGVNGAEFGLNAGLRQVEGFGEGGACAEGEFRWGKAEQRGGAWTSHPAGDAERCGGVGGPPDRGKQLAREQEAHGLRPEAAREEQGQPADAAHAQVGRDVEGLAGLGVEVYMARLQDAEGKRDHGLGRGECSGGDFDADLPGLPDDGMDTGVEGEDSSGGLEALGDEPGKAIIAVAEAPDAVSVDGILGGLLLREGPDRGLGGVRGVESLDVGERLVPRRSGDDRLVEILGEGDVRTAVVLELLEGFLWGVLVIVPGTAVRGTAFRADEVTGALVGGEVGLFDERPETGRATVDELGAELDDLTGGAESQDAATDPVLRFQQGDAQAGFGEASGGGESGDSRTNDHHV